MTIRLAPSILAADFAALGDAIAAAERGGADLIHVDVMDGHFVPNLTVGPPVVRSLKRVARVPLDVHLMITDPDRYVGGVRRRGRGDDLGARRGAAAPATARSPSSRSWARRPASRSTRRRRSVALEEVAADVDFVLVMTVNPGFGGQAFLPRSASKVSERASDARPGREFGAHRGRRRHRSPRPSGRSFGPAPRSWWPARRSSTRPTSPRPPGALRAAAEAALPSGAGSSAMTFPVTSPRESAAGCACGTPKPTRWASSTTRTTWSGSRWAAASGCGRPGAATGSSRRTATILPVIEAHCEYRRPVRYDDEIEIRAKATLLSPARVRFDYEVVPGGAAEPSRGRLDRALRRRSRRAGRGACRRR